MNTYLAITAVILYLLGFAKIVREQCERTITTVEHAAQEQYTLRKQVGATTAAILALSAHAGFAALTTSSADGINMTFFNAGVVVSCCIVLVSLAINAYAAFNGLLATSFLISAVAILCSLGFSSPNLHSTKLENGVLTHIILSVFAYSVFTLASIQAAFIHIQNRQLKKHISSRLISALPPLESMEKLLFDLIYFGTALLVVAIGVGFFFVDNFLAQHLSHKTFFSILSLTVFFVLIAGHTVYGWRGTTASKWTMIGFVLLIIGYFGSKAVIDLILHSNH